MSGKRLLKSLDSFDYRVEPIAENKHVVSHKTVLNVSAFFVSLQSVIESRKAQNVALATMFIISEVSLTTFHYSGYVINNVSYKIN